MVSIFRRKRNCEHDWKIEWKSNVLQLDEIGYPLRLCICKCSKCRKSEQKWLIESTTSWGELDTKDSVLLIWEKVKNDG